MTFSLTEINPPLDKTRLIAELTVPPRFNTATFETYIPDPEEPSQAMAKQRLAEFAGEICQQQGGGSLLRKIFKSRKPTAPGIYLDGGYGVGKTHLLASLFHAVGEGSVYGTFVEYTNLAGALGFNQAVELLSKAPVVCIDEFELDDVGDTLIMTRMIRELSDRGVRICATSNTLPEALGEGRFAAQDFLRDIQAMAERFEVIRIEGPDYRHRDQSLEVPAIPATQVRSHAADSDRFTLDEFPDLLAHLTRVHPSRYGQLLDEVDAVHWLNMDTITDHQNGLRLVVLIDRLYDRDLPIFSTGVNPKELFTQELLTSGYRKKYLRALSRITALNRKAHQSIT